MKFNTETSISDQTKSIPNSYQPNTTILKQCMYKKYTDEDLKNCVVGWVMQKKKTDMIKYCKSGNVPRTTLLTYLKHIPQLVQMREIENKTLQEVEEIYDNNIMKRNTERLKKLREVQDGNFYLSTDEVGTITYFTILLSRCGRGICKDEFLEIVNIILREKRTKENYVPATMKTVDGLLKRLDQLKSTVSTSSSIDPARATQANKDVRDSMFTKLENYIVLLHELGIFKVKSYSEIKSFQIYNMDECAIDTTKTNKKILCSKEEVSRLFQITPEGDRKMNLHISIALTSRADGKF